MGRNSRKRRIKHKEEINIVSATITEYIEVADPTMEVARLTVTDGETYTSRKFKTISGAVATGNADNDAHINVTFSAAVATINYAGMTDQLVTLLLVGKH